MLATVLPGSAASEAPLHAKTAGQGAQELHLRIDAFLYQRCGLVADTIKQVELSPINDGAASCSVDAAPRYPMTVALPTISILVYGKRKPFESGSRSSCIGLTNSFFINNETEIETEFGRQDSAAFCIHRQYADRRPRLAVRLRQRSAGWCAGTSKDRPPDALYGDVVHLVSFGPPACRAASSRNVGALRPSVMLAVSPQ